MSETQANGEQGSGKLAALLILAGAMLLLVGGIGAVLYLGGGRDVTPTPGVSLGDPLRGRQVVLKYGCIQCHSDDGTRQIGPSFKGLFGSTVTYDDGSTGLIDEADVRLSLRDPSSRIIAGFDPQMKPYPNITEDEIVNLLAYLRSIGAR